MSGTGEEIDREDEVYRVLWDTVTGLGSTTVVMIIEIQSGGQAVLWQVRRDGNGTPVASRRLLTAAELSDPAALRAAGPVLTVRTGGGPSGTPPAAAASGPAYTCRAPLAQVLREAIRLSPLTAAYELALLDEAPAGDPGPRRLELTGQPLFPVGASHGDKEQIQIRVEPAGSGRTALAVVTRDRQPNVPPKDQEFRPVQIQSALIPPGTWELTAELARPGRVHFHGLPAELDRPVPSPGQLAAAWREITRLLPVTVPAARPVHLVCLVELCGGTELLQLRVERLVKLITTAEESLRELAVTVVGYGPHSVTWAMEDEAPVVPAWAAPPGRAERALEELAARKPDEREYLRAAQLECALAWLADFLSARQGRPVLVAAGGRPPHPHRMDPRTQIIPCPDRVNWRLQLDRLTEAGAAFGAFRDRNWQGEAWQVLGRTVAATVDDPVDMQEFAAALGLHEPGCALPLPVAAVQAGN